MLPKAIILFTSILLFFSICHAQQSATIEVNAHVVALSGIKSGAGMTPFQNNDVFSAEVMILKPGEVVQVDLVSDDGSTVRKNYTADPGAFSHRVLLEKGKLRTAESSSIENGNINLIRVIYTDL